MNEEAKAETNEETESIFLLSAADEKYFETICKCISAWMKRIRLADKKERGIYEIKEDDLRRLRLPRSPRMAVDKWDKLTDCKHFSLWACEFCKPSERPHDEPLAEDEFFLNGEREVAYKQYFYLKSDNICPITINQTAPDDWDVDGNGITQQSEGAAGAVYGNNKRPFLTIVNEGHAAYDVVKRLVYPKDENEVKEVRDALFLNGYAFIPYEVYSSISFAVDVCRAVLNLPERGKPTTTGEEIISIPSADDRFRKIYQGTLNNTLTHIKDIKRNGLSVDEITGTATITRKDLVLKIPNYNELSGIKTSVHQLLDALTIKLTESGAKDCSVAMSIEEYMELRGLRDRRTALEQAANDMEILRSASVSWTERRHNQLKHYEFVNLAQRGAVDDGGLIFFKFTEDIFNVLRGYAPMAYPKLLQNLNSKHNPYSFFLLRKMSEHKNMNVKKDNEDIISVKTLLEAANFPSYDEIRKKGSKYEQLVIRPFERDMDALQDALQWRYCHKKGEPLTEEEINGMDYYVFIECNIYMIWNSYPDQTDRLKRKAERVKSGKKKPKKETSCTDEADTSSTEKPEIAGVTV